MKLKIEKVNKFIDGLYLSGILSILMFMLIMLTKEEYLWFLLGVILLPIWKYLIDDIEVIM